MSHLYNFTTPTGAYVEQRGDVSLTFNSDLFDKVFAADNLKRAWKQVRSNKGAAGVDGLDIESFLEWARQHWRLCKMQLFNGSYRPAPVRRVEIAKPDGGKRQLGIPTVLDYVLLASMAQA